MHRLWSSKVLQNWIRKTLRERIYEEVVRLIVSGELPSGGWVDEKLVIKRLRVGRTPSARRSGHLPREG
jgi:DNA-binding GntR family transcriptional regulator